MLYKIDLTTYGITLGSLGTAPYTAGEYTQAKANRTGLQAAMDFAYNNNYSGVLLPRGVYSLYYNGLAGQDITAMAILYPKSNQTIDLNGSTLEVMYDSANKNPDHTKNEAAYELQGSVFRVQHCHDVTIRNGEIKGDIYNRSFTDINEKWHEQTYAVYGGANAYNMTFENLNTHGFMGDAFTFTTRGYDGSKLIAAEVGSATPGYIIDDGTTVQLAGAYISPLIPINLTMLAQLTPYAPKTIQIQTSGGYTRIPNFANLELEIAFYTSGGTFISKQETKYVHKIVMPHNCAAVKLIFTGEAVGLSSLPNQGYTIMEQASNTALIRKCKIHNNHRGGISNPCDNIIIDDCDIYHNGLDSSIGAPIFPDNTRYGINFEDTYAQNALIKNCNIYSSFTGILTSTCSITIENNCFSDISYVGVVVYSSEKSFIHNNKFYCTALGVQDYNRKRLITFKDNYINTRNAAFALISNATTDEFDISYNDISCWILTLSGPNIKFNNNRLNFINKVFTPEVNYGPFNVLKEFKNNVTDATGSLAAFVIKADTYEGTIFKGFTNFGIKPNDTKANFDKAIFENCLMSFEHNNVSTQSLSFDGCKIKNSVFVYGKENMSGSNVLNMNISLKDCKVEIDTLITFQTEDYQTFAQSGRVYSFDFYNTTIEYLNTTKPLLMRYRYGGDIGMHKRKIKMSNIRVVNNTNFQNSITNGGLIE